MRRGLILLVTKEGRGLAGVLLGLLCGCLLPQEETVFPPLPEKANRPLQIVTTKPALIRPTYLVGGSGTNCSDPFSVAVHEPDVFDQIESRWFVDRGQNSPVYPGDLVKGNGTTVRGVTAPGGVANALSNLADGKEHVVEVFVTDGRFREVVGAAERDPTGTLIDGGPLIDTAYVDTHAWFVTVQPCR